MFKTDTNTPAAEIDPRIAKLQAALTQKDLDGALILQTSDLFYFSGTIQQSHLYVPAHGEAVLMARKSFKRAQAESPLKQLVFLSSLKQLPSLLKNQGLSMPRRLGLELDVLPVNIFRVYEKLFNHPEIIDISPEIRQIRAIKSDYELNLIAKAASMSDAVAGHVREILQPGMTELELAGLVEAYARQLGHQGIIRMRMFGGELFYGHLLCGASAAVPSFLASPTGGLAANNAVAQGAGFNKIRPHEPILLDYAFALDGYISDHTRIFALNGLPDDLLAAHTAMLSLQKQIKSAAKPGVTGGQLYEMGLEIASEAGYSDYFMGADAQRIQFIGHGVGLELDEFPLLAKGQKMLLSEKMVIALEPKLIFPGRGVVGIENTHVVTPDGLRQLGQYTDEVTVI